MNRNVESHFGHIATKNIRRSKFKRDCSFKCTLNTGDIVPIYVDEVLPGDTVKLSTAELVRMTTPIDPVMDNAWIDTYFFFVPRRLVWEHWREFMGENRTDAWTQETEYQIPQTEAPAETGWDHKSIAHYMGARMGTTGISIDSCYLRAYALIYNEWFRNQNVSEPAEVTLDDSTTTGTNGDDYVKDIQKGGHFAKAVKYADYFTRALPEPQKGPDVYIPIGSMAPVNTADERLITGKQTALNFAIAANGNYAEPQATGRQLVTNIGYAEGNAGNLGYNELLANLTQNTGENIYPTNLYADLTAAAGATINQLRQAFAVQRMYELDARGGTRYIEILATHFGVNSPDGRQQRPEYLGGKRVPINITQVLQTSSTDATTPQGNTAAMSLTIDTHDDFTKSFTEHGIIVGLAVVRTEHTYQQGINRILSRKNRTDFYWPALANIGETYIKNKEIFAQGTTDDEEAFGYQEAWAEYRYGINRIAGELNSDYSTPLDSWHYGDDYDTLPTLSDAWIKETDANVDRTLAITTQDQFIADFYFDQTWTRPMPIYSIPALTGWN